MLELGRYHTLTVLRSTSVGLYLDDGGEGILLPIRYVPENVKVGDAIKVFVYLDNDDRPIATTLEPFSQINEFAFLTVKEVNEHGAFLDWGIAKDIFVPYAEQREVMMKGRDYLVYILQDDVSGRIAATEKWLHVLEQEDIDLEVHQEVQLLIAEQTNLGFRAIINNKYEGLLYKTEIFEPLEPGMRLPGFVRHIREDKKIDLILQLPGMKHIEATRDQVMHYLIAHDGFLPLGDKSSPEEIYATLNISKKAFKKTIGTLYKERYITIGDHEVRLAKSVKRVESIK